MGKTIAAIILTLFALLIIARGIKLNDHIETEFNANLLCLSCIGIE